MSVLDDDFYIEGKILDEAYYQAGAKPLGLLDEMFADTSNDKSPSGKGTGLLDAWMRIYGVTDTSGTTTDRRNRVIAAMRARGGLSARYFAKLIQSFGYNLARDYTTIPVSASQVPVDIFEGGRLAFIVSSNLSDVPAPTQIYNPPNVLCVSLVNIDSIFTWIVTIHGVSSAPGLFEFLDAIKPAWTVLAPLQFV